MTRDFVFPYGLLNFFKVCCNISFFISDFINSGLLSSFS
jgi:hypothetical protein